MKEILFQEYFELHWDSLLFVLFSWVKVCGICCCISKEEDAEGVSRKMLLEHWSWLPGGAGAAQGRACHPRQGAMCFPEKMLGAWFLLKYPVTSSSDPELTNSSFCVFRGALSPSGALPRTLKSPICFLLFFALIHVSVWADLFVGCWCATLEGCSGFSRTGQV